MGEMMGGILLVVHYKYPALMRGEICESTIGMGIVPHNPQKIVFQKWSIAQSLAQRCHCKPEEITVIAVGI